MTPTPESVLEPGGRLDRLDARYEDRPGQRHMSRVVADAIHRGQNLLVEAGTGIGKTMAYLVPALQSGKRVVVSTATKTLQDQILLREVPTLRKILSDGFQVSQLKGVSNYLCLRKLHASSALSDPLISLWRRETERGELSELPPKLKSHHTLLSTTSESRLGKSCDYYETCYVTRARRDAGEADLIIVNHHLLCSDFALKRHDNAGRVLPPYDVLIIDEAHRFEETFASYLGTSVSSRTFTTLGRDLVEVTSRNEDLCGGPFGTDEGERYQKRLLVASDRYFEQCRIHFKSLLSQARETKIALPNQAFFGALEQSWFDLDENLDALIQFLRERDRALADLDRPLSFLSLVDRVQRARDALAEIAQIESEESPRFRWGDFRRDSVTLQISPMSVARDVQNQVLKPGRSVVFTSATLSTHHGFEYTQRRLGVEEVEALSIPSPFDYANCAMLYIARDLPEPTLEGPAPEQHERLLALLKMTEGQAFVLFTSHHALGRAAAFLKEQSDFPLMVQGQNSRSALLAEFKRRKHAVLLGTNSFWEGVDVPGPALSQVIIDRLPFQNPSDPVHEAKYKHLASQGLDPFEHEVLPKAALLLKQGVGRLIRSKHDRGIVSILDARVVTKNYGKHLLDSLPPMPRTSILKRVETWWSEKD